MTGEGEKRAMQLEICVDRVESAEAAERGGADRIELCGNLVIGGTTPDPELFRILRERLRIPIHVMIRPRYGDFCYTEEEFRIMCENIRVFRSLGADGIVCGALRPDGTLDTERMREMIRLGAGGKITLHRCFDLCRDPFSTLEQAAELGVDILLTSGQRERAEDATEMLRALRERAAGRLLIQAGAGVNAGNIERICGATGITAYHMSGKILRNSPMRYRKEGVSMGIPSIGEYEIPETDELEVKEARRALNRISGAGWSGFREGRKGWSGL